ncbi:MAG: reverse transcriptase domain-containing protein, partial [Holophagaceae bacterium]
MSTTESKEAISSVRYYQLDDSNVETFFDDWRTKTLMLAEIKGFGSPFTDKDVAIPSQLEAEKSDASEAVKKMYKANKEANNLLVMSCSGIPLGLVRRAKGDAREALAFLDQKYAKKSITNVMSLIREWNNCRLESTSKDPDAWFVELDKINDKLSQIDPEYAMKDHQIKAHLLGSLPAGYEDVETKINGKESEFTVRLIETEISNKWQRTFSKSVKSNGGKGNVALSAETKGNSGGKGGGKKNKFKGRCRKCGKVGHKKADCRSNATGVCFECGEDGHFARDCPKKKKDGEGGATSGTGMFVGMAEWCMECTTEEVLSVDDAGVKFLLDSGASTHIVPSDEGLRDSVTSNESVKVGSGTVLNATKQGSLVLKCGSENTLKLDGVQVVPGMIKRIISIGRLSKNGNKISMDGTKMVIENPQGTKIVVEQEPDTHLYYLSASVLREVTAGGQEANSAQKESTPEKPKPVIDINDAHELYGHLNYGVLAPLLEKRGYVIYQGGKNRKSCETCAYAKAKAKAVSKTSLIKATEKGERLFMDISGPYKMSLIGSKYWVLIVDDKTRKAWSFFVKTKNEAKSVTGTLLTLFKGVKVSTKYLRCDNAGENVKGLRELCDEHGIQIELTPPHSPQFNGVVERKFVTIRDRAHAMMLGAHLDETHQGNLWAEAVSTATKLHNAVPNRVGAAPDELWYGAHKGPRILEHLVQWGRIGYVTNRLKQPKLTPKATKMVCMGYAKDHAGDVYRMYNPENGVIIESRDVKWAEWHGGQPVPESLKMFAAHTNIDLDDFEIEDTEFEAHTPTPDRAMGAKPHVIPDDEDETPNFEAGRIDEDPTKSSQDAAAGRKVARSTAAPTTRLERELRRLEASYNPTAGLKVNSYNFDEPELDNREEELHSAFSAELSSDPGEPKNIQEALNSDEKLAWLNAIKKEIENFLARGVWKKVPTSQLKKGQRPISTKWIFKKKQEHDGSTRYKARCVVRGFVQVPGIDFTLTHSPVAAETSVRLCIAIALFFEEQGWDIEMLDIEAAFLEAPLKEDVYIAWPDGLVRLGFVNRKETEGTCIHLGKAMYGTVQAPLAFFNEFAKLLRKIGLTQSKTDPCVWFKWADDRIWLVVTVYVDDVLYAGSKEARLWFKNQVKSRFNIVDLGKLSKHLGVWYKHKHDKGKRGYYEMSMIKYQSEILSDFEEATGRKVTKAATPGYPGETLVRSTDSEVIDIENFRKLLGKCMWFCKKIMPECCNAIRELASSMDHPGEAQWRAMGRLIGYLATQEPATLILKKPRDLKVYGYVDSNWATNKESRKSVTGYVLTLGGCLITWSSKNQPTVALSSTEAEYIAASTCATEIKFVQMLLEEVIPEVKTRPATLFEDNTGCIYLIENKTVGNRTKHIDIKMHHIREMSSDEVEEARLQIMFTNSQTNFADPMTKNVTESIQESLIPPLKDGRIAEVIFHTVNREDVG